MSYRERIGKGSWRGVRFEITASRVTFGRRLVRHSYPLKDVPFVEDMGRLVRVFEITGFVVGDDYDLDKARMIAAVEKGDPGPLVHPYYGATTVQCETFEISESSSRARQFGFTAQFVESGSLTFPAVATSSTQSSTAIAATARAAAKTLLTDRYDVTGAGFLKDAADLRIAALFDSVETAVNPFRNELTDVAAFEDAIAAARAKTTLSGDAGLFADEIFDLLDLLDARRMLTQLADALANETSVATPTPTDQQNSDNLGGLDLLTRRAALIDASVLAIAEVFESTDEALAVRDDLAARLATELEESDLDDPTYTALVDLRTELTRDLSDDAAQLPDLVDLDFVFITSTLEIAQLRHGDGDRETEVAARNRVVHPGFVTGVVQVLSQ